MTGADTLSQGREAFERRAWAEAYSGLEAADRTDPLDPEDLERLAMAAYLVGKEAASSEAWARAHHGFLSRGAVERAARCAFWLSFALLNGGERARAGGWVARGHRLLEGVQRDCVERGYLLLPVAMKCIGEGDLTSAYDTLRRAAAFGDRFGDPDLVALARHSRGRVLIRMGDVEQGVGLLDEAMAAVEAGELSAIVVGTVYCSVIEGCLEIYDLRRAQEWTAALARWCASQPDLVAYRGECLVRRAEILRLHGAWQDARDAAQRACDRLSRGPRSPATGAAFYQKAELHRLCGEVAAAEEAYRQASRWGRKPQPGLARLRLHQGHVGAAEAALLRAVEEARDRVTRARLLPAYVEVLLAAEQVEAARGAAEELAEIAALDAPYLRAVAAEARGAVLLAEDEAAAALDALRRAWAAWQEVRAPYEAARVRVLIGRACRELGDEETAELETDAAREVFRHLGAAPALDRLAARAREAAPEAAAGLTPRQVEVLRLVATGKTNREIADVLFISEKTVARHVSNIFARLGLSSRAAATAYAYRHDLA